MTSRTPSRQPLPLQRTCTLYKACTLALALPAQLNSEKAIVKYLSDLLVKTILSWVYSLGGYNPFLPFKAQQTRLIQFIVKSPTLPPSIHRVRQYLLISLSKTQLDRSSRNYRHYQKIKQSSSSPSPFVQPESPFIRPESQPQPPEAQPQPIHFDSLYDVPSEETTNYLLSQSTGNIHQSTHQQESHDPPSPPTSPPSQPTPPDPHPTLPIVHDPHHPVSPIPPKPPLPCDNPTCTIPCNIKCFVCNFFSFHHPSTHCIWTTKRITRRPKMSYSIPPLRFEFCREDLLKMQAEDIKITQKFEGIDASTTSYSQSSSSSLSDSSQHSSKKRSKRPTFYSYLISRGEEHAEALKTYTDWKKALPKEGMGTSRPLLPQEIAYFDFAQKYYQCDTTRPHKHRFVSPPKCWQKRLDDLCKPTDYYQHSLNSLAAFSRSECAQSQRNNWNQVLGSLQEGSLQRVLWALAFLKSTNGVADKVSCCHFKKLIEKDPRISLDLCDEPYQIAAMIRQTSKWVKNTFVISNIFRYIRDVWNGIPSTKFNDWLQFKEIGPKTASLLFYAAFNMSSTLPVDSHVWHAFKQWKWTNATSEDECSWQALKWMESSYFIMANDAIGSIRQALADKKKKKKLLTKANRQPKEIRDLIYALV